MKRNFVRAMVLVSSAGMLLQLGGCVSKMLADVFFAVGPFLL